MKSKRVQRIYDHRLVELVQQTQDPSIPTRRGIPRSTVAGWLRRAPSPVTTTGTAEESMAQLRARVARLEKRVELLRAVLRILFALLRIVKPNLSRLRVPAPDKARLLRAIRRTQGVLGLQRVLGIVGLSASRLHAWPQAERGCLLDNTRVYLHAVIDTYSRRILAWRLADRFDPSSSVAVLVEASKAVETSAPTPTLLADAGVENKNKAVDELIASGVLKRVLAQTEIHFSNSLIEAWWRDLKHQWLLLHALDSATKVRSLVAFYVAEHNSRLPHSAFRGQTPDEMFFGTGESVPAALAASRAAARRTRLEVNRAQHCAVCA